MKDTSHKFGMYLNLLKIHSFMWRLSGEIGNSVSFVLLDEPEAVMFGNAGVSDVDFSKYATSRSRHCASKFLPKLRSNNIRKLLSSGPALIESSSSFSPYDL
ncbi:hypothetical protein LIER_39005 [Lithospermum erythrorhizon]|uniref:Uncharacterized protein n=1 Tax=Lithospermum erythrorhizon TaxID=34254 RepID=A0AAV3QDJ7_LITER